jgi:hypothetical protein
MYHLATIFPGVRRIRIPLSRDQWMLLMMATNLVFLAVDIYLAHLISGTIVPNEWIPIVFGAVGGVLLLLAGLIAIKFRTAASIIATLTFAVSIGVGLLGAYFHVVRGIMPTAPLGERVSIDLLVWAPPVLGPLMFAMVGMLGISAVWREDPPDSGRLILWRTTHLQLPYPKTQAYFYIVGMAALATIISSVLDHARADFSNPWLWIPNVIGIFGTTVAATLGAINKPARTDLITYFAAMILLIIVGVIGLLLHVTTNQLADGTLVLERFIRGAPFMAPLLFANVGTIGLIALLDPTEPPSLKH